MASILSALAVALDDELERDQRTANSQIEAVDDHGLIRLVGTALTHEAHSAAYEIALHYPGVLSVINDLVVDDPDATSEVGIIVPLPTDMAYRGQ